MTKTELAQKRNMLKFRLLGSSSMFITNNCVTQAELSKMLKIKIILDDLLQQWDSEASYLGLIIKPHKCSCCGKRGNKEYILENKNYCYKHYKIFTDGNNNH